MDAFVIDSLLLTIQLQAILTFFLKVFPLLVPAWFYSLVVERKIFYYGMIESD
jgi:hypothetical protein